MTGNVKLKSVINGRRTEISISNDLSRSDAPKIAKIASRFIFKGTDVGIEESRSLITEEGDRGYRRGGGRGGPGWRRPAGQSSDSVARRRPAKPITAMAIR